MTVEDWLGSENRLGIDIWTRKYQYNNETFEEWLDRVSDKDEDVKNLIKERKFLFAGRILSNRGIPTDEVKTTYSNCYVITPPEDNLESIYETCKKLARTYSYGGGCGIDISNLSPDGAKVRNQAKSTSGAVSFMDTFAQVTEQIGQHGRRGALMISMKCDHPDIEKFITVKSDLNKVNYANISVMVTDDFMKAVEKDLDWKLTFTRPETEETIEKVVKAKDLFNLLCEQNWNYAEPGILFWDTISNNNLLNNNPDFSYAGTNPCAEEPLPAGGSCLLGSLNLGAFVKEDKTFDWDSFNEAIHISVDALNDVLDEGLKKHPLAEQRVTVKDWRQIGLGIMGLADALIKLEIKYGSPESIKFCDKLGAFLATNALDESANLAKEEGHYPKYDAKVLTSNFFSKNANVAVRSKVGENGLRNSQLLTIAPTGTISTMLGISGGIEPIFANFFTRRTQSLYGDDVSYDQSSLAGQYMLKNNIDDPSLLPDYFVTSADIPVNERIAMQGVWQKHIDASISSTVNLPNEATVNEVKEIYMSAWKNGLKGVTVYRAGCAREAILTNTENKAENKKTSVSVDSTRGYEYHLNTGCGTLHICAFFNEEGQLVNTYLSKGSSGGCNNFMVGLSRMISLAARNGASIEAIVDQLNSAGTCPSYAVRRATKGDTSPGASCPVAIGKALTKLWEFVNNKKIPSLDQKLITEIKKNESAVCPECGEEVLHENGCVTCKSCGWSKCG